MRGGESKRFEARDGFPTDARQRRRRSRHGRRPRARPARRRGPGRPRPARSRARPPGVNGRGPALGRPSSGGIYRIFSPCCAPGDAPPEIRRFAARGLLPLDARRPDAGAAGRPGRPRPRDRRRRRGRPSPRCRPTTLSRFLENADPTRNRGRLDRPPQRGRPGARAGHPATGTWTTRRCCGSRGPCRARAQDALVVNQVRLLRLPALIDALFENPDLTRREPAAA